MQNMMLSACLFYTDTMIMASEHEVFDLISEMSGAMTELEFSVVFKKIYLAYMKQCLRELDINEAKAVNSN